MTRLSFVIAILLLSASWADIADARDRMSVAQAERECLKKAREFARQPHGRDFGTPPPDLVDHRFRLCVGGKSGQSPKSKLKIRGFNLSISGTIAPNLR